METVLQSFPEQRAEILHLLRIDPNFREMCEDYETVADQLTLWLRTHDVAQAQIVAWRVLLHELETEIHEALREYRSQRCE